MLFALILLACTLLSLLSLISIKTECFCESKPGLRLERHYDTSSKSKTCIYYNDTIQVEKTIYWGDLNEKYYKCRRNHDEEYDSCNKAPEDIECRNKRLKIILPVCGIVLICDIVFIIYIFISAVLTCIPGLYSNEMKTNCKLIFTEWTNIGGGPFSPIINIPIIFYEIPVSCCTPMYSALIMLLIPIIILHICLIVLLLIIALIVVFPFILPLLIIIAIILCCKQIEWTRLCNIHFI